MIEEVRQSREIIYNLGEELKNSNLLAELKALRERVDNSHSEITGFKKLFEEYNLSNNSEKSEITFGLQATKDDVDRYISSIDRLDGKLVAQLLKLADSAKVKGVKLTFTEISNILRDMLNYEPLEREMIVGLNISFFISLCSLNLIHTENDFYTLNEYLIDYYKKQDKEIYKAMDKEISKL
ncbi:hypothetical protein MKY87_23630 [Paenibacillus sp. FSL R7-0198]|uniref:hypothetical protein n=1 Tax=Paenibacillus sp. FSL R7-0198 TaxID=2921674 RepID=UPI0030F53C45